MIPQRVARFSPLLRLAGRLCAVFALLVVVVRVLGSFQPPPAALARLHLIECALPCWFGITPGTTTFDEAAQSVLAAFPDATVLRDSVILADFSADKSYARVILQARDGVIGWILLNFDESAALAIGDLVARFGSPACGLSSPRRMIAYSSAQSYAAIVIRDQWRSRWHNPLVSIDIGVSRPIC